MDRGLDSMIEVCPCPFGHRREGLTRLEMTAGATA